MPTDYYGVVRDDESLTYRELARRFKGNMTATSVRWVRENILGAGCPARFVAGEYFISGVDFNTWVRIGATTWDEKKASG